MKLGTHMPDGERRKPIDIEVCRSTVKVTLSIHMFATRLLHLWCVTDFFQLLNWFWLFSSGKKSESWPFERGCRWFQLFFIDFQLFYFVTRIIPVCLKDAFLFSRRNPTTGLVDTVNWEAVFQGNQQQGLSTTIRDTLFSELPMEIWGNARAIRIGNILIFFQDYKTSKLTLDLQALNLTWRNELANPNSFYFQQYSGRICAEVSVGF